TSDRKAATKAARASAPVRRKKSPSCPPRQASFCEEFSPKRLRSHNQSMKKILLATLLLPVCALGVEIIDCAAANQLVTLYQLRSLMLRGDTSSYDIDKFIDAKLDTLREPLTNGGFRWVRWVRPSGNPEYDKHGHTVAAAQGSGSDNFEASGNHAFAVRVA